MATRILSLRQLKNAAQQRRAVVVPDMHCFSKPLPAGFVIFLQGDLLLRLLDAGMYLVEKKPTKTKGTK